MTDSWYDVVAPEIPLMQRDLILGCPIIAWSDAASMELSGAGDLEVLQNAVSAIIADVVVMTQACDLEQQKVVDVVLCPHVSLEDYHKGWEGQVWTQGQNPTAKAWRTFCEDA